MRQFVLTIAAAVLCAGTAIAQSGRLPQPTSPNNSVQQQAVEQNLKDVRFAFDSYELSDEARKTLQANADWLKAHPDAMVSIAGDADERGEIVYNLTLSDHRAKATRDALVQLGIPADRIIFATGWGKLYPVCAQADETCWSQNRRAHFTSGTDLQTQTVAKKADAMPIIACATLDCP